MKLISETDWWVTEYVVDIHKAMKEKEKKRKLVKGRSPQLGFRRHLVEWLEKVCNKHLLSGLTLHLAVLYMDHFMDCHSIETEQLQLVALSCLLVAAKSEEKDILIPKASEVNRTADDQYRIGDFFQMEVTLLDFFQWDLVTPTTVHFLDYYIKYAILTTDFVETPKVFKTIDEGNIYVEKYGEHFKTIALRETAFLKYTYSVVASSIVASIRICLLLQPYWPKTLQTITEHSGSSISPCVELLLRFLEDEEKDLNNSLEDSGISIGSPGSSF